MFAIFYSLWILTAQAQTEIVLTFDQIDEEYFLDAAYDDTNLIDPAGDQSSNHQSHFVESIVFENLDSSPVRDFYPVNKKRDFRSVNHMLDSLSSRTHHPLIDFYMYRKDNIYHASSFMKENSEILPLVNYWGYGWCSDDVGGFSNIADFMGVPNRSIPLNGHAAKEFYFNNKWNIIDGDRNNIYLLWDNQRLASYQEVVSDPFLALRNKTGGKYNGMSIKTSWKNASLFEYLSPPPEALTTHPGELPIQKSFLTDADGFTLFSTETLKYLPNSAPPIPIGVSEISEWGSVKENTLGTVHHRISPKARLKEKRFSYHSPFPIISIGNKTESIFYISELNRQLDPGNTFFLLHHGVVKNLSLTRLTGPYPRGHINISMQGSKATFPILLKGKNRISLSRQEQPINISARYVLRIDKQLPSPPIISPKSNYKFTGEPVFTLRNSKVYDLIWRQISNNDNYSLVIPNFDTISASSANLSMDKLSNTFLNNAQQYFFRARGRRNGIWSDWTKLSFSVSKPARVSFYKFEKNGAGDITLSWDSANPDKTEYLVFGSKSRDFLPEIYFDKRIDEHQDNPRIYHYEKNTNLIQTTRNKHLNITDALKYPYYRIVAKSDKAYSNPSSLIVMPIFSEPGWHDLRDFISRNATDVVMTDILQTRHKIVEDPSQKNGYYDVYHAKRKNITSVESDASHVLASIENADEYRKKLLLTHGSNSFDLIHFHNPEFTDNFFIRFLRYVKWTYWKNKPERYYGKYSKPVKTKISFYIQ
ncbi:hypothetical protein OAJ78_00690 [Gammaproteobacteria bacterium]|nr:hypothetical protein [Gammaproteobacteria bacterium]